MSETTNLAVHRYHCCRRHGCKYGKDDCPVEAGAAVQVHPCEWCQEADSEEAEIRRDERERAGVTEIRTPRLQEATARWMHRDCVACPGGDLDDCKVRDDWTFKAGFLIAAQLPALFTELRPQWVQEARDDGS